MRPYIICHMIASLDGRIDCAMTEQIDDTNHYYDVLDSLDCPSMMEGKTTLVMHSALPGSFLPTQEYRPAGHQIYKSVESKGYMVGVDTRGTLLWSDDTTEHFGKPLVMLLSEQASQEYLDYLRGKHISFITIGEQSIDLAQAMEILHDEFCIHRLAVTGGGHLNGSMLDLGLIDEISMMYGYGIDGREGMPAAFDGRYADRQPIRLQFLSVNEQDGIVWMRYKVK